MRRDHASNNDVDEVKRCCWNTALAATGSSQSSLLQKNNAFLPQSINSRYSCEMPRSSPRATIFSFHTMDFGARKAGFVFVAEELANLGWQVEFVTTHLSRLSELARVPRLAMVPPDRRNVWIEHSKSISTFVWVPLFHPATSPSRIFDMLATPLFSLHPYLLPRSVLEKVRTSRLVIIESSSAVQLFPYLKRSAPDAQFVYAALDPLTAVGMHPMLSKVLDRTAIDYDLVTAPSHEILEGLPPGAKKFYLPQGLEKELFDVTVPSPFIEKGPHGVVAGEMMFDLSSFGMMVRNFPDITFHAFGNMNLESLGNAANLRQYGEVPFESLRDYIVHADFGIAPYLDQPELHYLAESSLKLVQYTYSGLPILAPNFCKRDRAHVIGYEPGNETSINDAVKNVCKFDRENVDRSGVYDWREVTLQLLHQLDLPTQN